MADKNDNVADFLEKTIKQSQDKFLLKTTLDFKQQFKSLQLGHKVTEVQLECEGYGYFDKTQKRILENFVKYFTQLETICTSKVTLRSLRITLNGFNIGNEIKSITKCIRQMSSSVKIFSFHTADLTGLQEEDFNSLVSLINDLGKQNNDFSLQCANWKFKGQPPNLDRLVEIMKDIKMTSSPLPQKRLRLQISGWYYDEEDARHFMKVPKKMKVEDMNKQVCALHQALGIFLQDLLAAFECLQELQFDMRNSHPILQMDKLKKYLIANPLNQQRQEMNMMSIRNISATKRLAKQKAQNNTLNSTQNNKQSDNQQKKAEEKKTFKLVIEM